MFEDPPVRVIADKTSTNRTNITIMACVNATGMNMPPMFIVKEKTSASLHGFNTEAAPTGSL